MFWATFIAIPECIESPEALGDTPVFLEHLWEWRRYFKT